MGKWRLLSEEAFVNTVEWRRFQRICVASPDGGVCDHVLLLYIPDVPRDGGTGSGAGHASGRQP